MGTQWVESDPGGRGWPVPLMRPHPAALAHRPYTGSGSAGSDLSVLKLQRSSFTSWPLSYFKSQGQWSKACASPGAEWPDPWDSAL